MINSFKFFSGGTKFAKPILVVLSVLLFTPHSLEAAEQKDMPRTIGFSLLGGVGYSALANFRGSERVAQGVPRITYHGGVSIFFAAGKKLKYPWLQRLGVEVVENGFARTETENYRVVSLALVATTTPFKLVFKPLKWWISSIGLAGHIGEIGGSVNPFGIRTGLGAEFPVTDFFRIATVFRSNWIFARSLVSKNEFSTELSFFF